MKLFECQNCGQLLFFHNTRCERCGLTLGYQTDRLELTALVTDGESAWRPVGGTDGRLRFCANAAYGVCNWLVADDGPDAFCRACRLNRTIPNLDTAGNLLLWERLEDAKHRLVYGLLRLGLPVLSKRDDAKAGFVIDFLAGPDLPGGGGDPVTTGHADGIITIDVAEADDAKRERQRRDLAEPFRTLLGHLRHEVGHHYWNQLVLHGVWHTAFRQMFGDERQDYAGALKAHYAAGPPSGWEEHYVSGYAAAHPWEDFAETWAHYLHIVDTLETASAFGMRLEPARGRPPVSGMAIDFDPYRHGDFNALMAAWLPLTYAVNSLNSSMGQPELYPFVLSPTVMGKLRFIHGLVAAKTPSH